MGWPSYVESESVTGAAHTYSLTVPPATAKLKVTLVWDDKGGTAQAGGALINDLDLALVDPSANQVLPWVLNPMNPSIVATHGADHTNNVETVEITNPASGSWTALVTGYNIPNGPQKYSLIFTPDSINGTQAARSVDIRKEQDTSANPGQSLSIGFWAKNAGMIADSIRVTLSDSLGWLTSTMDTVVQLNSFDSVRVVRPATVPASATAGSVDSRLWPRRTCPTRPYSIRRLHWFRHERFIRYRCRQADPIPVLSPSLHAVTSWVKNAGNAVNDVAVTASNDSGWAIQPARIDLSINPGDSGVAIFSLTVPNGGTASCDEPHNFVGSRIGRECFQCASGCRDQ